MGKDGRIDRGVIIYIENLLRGNRGGEGGGVNQRGKQKGEKFGIFFGKIFFLDIFG